MTVCVQCGEDNPERARFCLSCASPLPTDDVDRELRKTVTAVFCDMTGSTEMGERLDPESVRRVMERFYEEMRSALEADGGTVEKFIGDAVVAVFGVPMVHEDDGLRAVRAGSSTCATACAQSMTSWSSAGGFGSGSGPESTPGRLLPVTPEKGESFVVGDAINTAPRLEQAAPRDEIFLGAETFRLVRAMVETRADRTPPAQGQRGAGSCSPPDRAPR